jgi:hypothetical protein
MYCKTVLGGLIIMDVELINCYESNLSLYMLQSHAIERPEDAMRARSLIGRNLG